ncbi:MAG: DUF1109 domain-containing protein [Caulobacter sp.]|nr:DUF1109 domain-containing protein [Caulobacter sp.]
MRTDDLIARLAADTAPIQPHALERRLTLRLATGGLLALVLLLLLMGPRPDLGVAAMTVGFWLKTGFTLLVLASALVLTVRLARPGGRAGPGLWLALLAPFVLMAALAGVVLAGADPGARLALWLGQSWAVCPVWILLLSSPVLIAALLALRRFAPTRPALAGLAAGLAAGGLGATVYGLHCQESAVPFLATWYALGIIIVGGVGAALGARFLRW